MSSEGKYRWRVALPDGQALEVQANTASEARARSKPRLGLRPRDRLPVGTRARKLGAAGPEG